MTAAPSDVDRVEDNAQQQNRTALPLLWLHMHGDSLYAYALRRVRRREAAEDLVQETLLSALQAADRFRHQCSPRTWLISILRNKISDHLRARYSHAGADSLSPEDDELFDRRGIWKVPVPRWRADPAELAELREFQAVLAGCMAKLPTQMAYLFVSRTTDGCSTAQLCSELKISSENAWMLLHRARGRLRQCLTLRWFANQPATSPVPGAAPRKK
jgi:RNA polymerase sigma-70 factor (ECF subfamily)